MPQKAAREIARTIKSAAANAENNFEMAPDDLVVKTIFADEGRRSSASCRAPAARRPYPKRTTHITVIVDDGEEIYGNGTQSSSDRLSSGLYQGLAVEVVCRARNYTDQLHEDLRCAS